MENNMTYRVAADIRYLDGTFTGMVIPAGFNATYPSVSAAHRCVSWLKRVQADADFVRAIGTGHRYEIEGGITVEELKPVV